MKEHLIINDEIANIPRENMHEITSIEFGEKVEEIREYAFENCSKLKEINFSRESKLKIISKLVFNNCLALESVAFPDSIEEIDDFAFYGCVNLTKISLPKSKINGIDFSKADEITKDQLNKFKMQLGLPLYCDIYFGNDAEPIYKICHYDSISGKVTFDNKCTMTEIKQAHLGGYTFNRNIKSISICDSIKKIEYNAFSNFGGLTEMRLPKSKINDIDFSKPDKITERQMNNFKSNIGLRPYCDIRVDGKLIEPSIDAKIKQRKEFLYGECNTYYSNKIKTTVRAQLVRSYKNSNYLTGVLTSDENKQKSPKEKEEIYIKMSGEISGEIFKLKNDLVTNPELKKQCVTVSELGERRKFNGYVDRIKQKAKDVYQTKKALIEIQHLK